MVGERAVDLPLRNGQCVRVDEVEFMLALRVEFPALADELNDETWRGLVHLEASCLARHTRQAIDAGDEHEVQRCFDFVRLAWMAGDDAVCNALAVSYVEHLNFDDCKVRRSWAFDLLAPVLRQVAVELGAAPNKPTRERR